MLSDETIERAKNEFRGSYTEIAHHEHNDCIRIAYEWLDAQKKIKGTTHRSFALKHIIEKWGGRYVSQSDVEIAAHLHPDVIGTYPMFNISSRLTRPNDRRLIGVSEAFRQDYRELFSERIYSRVED